MAWQIPLSTTGPSIALNLGVYDSGIVAQGVTLASTTHRGIYAGGTDQDIIVHGTVIGNNGIRLFNATGTDVVIGATGHAIGFGGPGVSGKGNFLEVHNAGIIETLAGNLPAVQFQGPSAGSVHELTNSDLIRGEEGVEVSYNVVAFRLENSGRIEATGLAFEDIGSSADTILNSGVIDGTVLMGGGADLYDGRTGFLSGVVSGGAGMDRILGGRAIRCCWAAARTTICAEARARTSWRGMAAWTWPPTRARRRG